MDTETFDFDATTLVGDVRDKILAELTVAHDQPWNLRPEAQQREVAERVHDLARGLVREVVMRISDAGFPSLQGTLEAVAVKSGFKAVVKVPKGADHWEDLIRSEGRDVVLVIADPLQFFKTRGAVPIVPDQKPLPYAEEAAAVADAAETPPDGYQGEEGGDPVAEESQAGDRMEAEGSTPLVTTEDGAVLVQPQATYATLLDGKARFVVVACGGEEGVSWVWKGADGQIWGHAEEKAARAIAARMHREDMEKEDDAWDTAEERQERRRQKAAAE